MTGKEILNLITEIGITYGTKLLGAIVVWIIGRWVIKGIVKAIVKIMDKKETEETLKKFIKIFLNIVLQILLIISVLTMLGVEMTSFIALLGAAGLAIGMALSGTLQNFAGGVMLLIFKPFKVGDVIEAQGFIGSVNEIQLFNTILKTPDNRTIIIPNSALVNVSMVNYSTEPQRRVDWTFGIGYGDDVEKAKAVIQRLCEEDERILKEPPVFIGVSELADSSVNLTVRAWVKGTDYWDVFFDMNKKIYETFTKEGLNIPYPQMDVHLHNNA